MTKQPKRQPAVSAPAPQFLPLLLALFVGSGCAALIYEIVWFQLLQLIIGSSAVSLGVLLGTFMGGMCLGSLSLWRVVSPRQHPLRVYALLELGIGALGILVFLGMPLLGRLYATVGGYGLSGIFLRGLFSGICLLPPTLLMGATLPAIARWVKATPRGVSWLGFFYGGNTVGAVFGCLAAGFYLLRIYDVAAATCVAAALNVIVAATAFTLARFTPHLESEPAVAQEPGGAASDAWPVYVAIALSGMSALGAEVVWTRLLTLLLGGTTYTFSIILAVFLIGIGLGSSIGSYAARELVRPRQALGVAQFLLAGAITWSAWAIARSLPYWPVNPTLTTNPWLVFQVDFVRCLWAILPAALLWGASFPLALASVASEREDPGRMVGAVYAANTVGAIAGALAFSMLLIPWVGTQSSQRILIALAALSAVLMLVPWVSRLGRLRFDARSAVWLVLTIGVAVGLAASVVRVPGLLVAYGRFMALRLQDQVDIIYMGEGMNSSMAVSRLADGTLNYHNAGKVQASSEPQDMRLQRMLGHLTTLVPQHPRSVLVIGCGAGVTAGAVSIDPQVERVTIVEIESLVPRVVSQYFSAYNYDVVRNPKVRVQVDDARHYVLTTREKFDAVTSDPFDPWVKGAATLYTTEFFEDVKKHLNPGGVVTVFVQLYWSNLDAVKSEIATFLQVFPNGIIWGNTYGGGGYDLVLLGRAEQTPINLDETERRLRSPEYAPVAQSLREVGFYSTFDLFSTFTAQGPQLQPWLRDAQINHDWNLRLQYLAGLGLNEYQQTAIYHQIVAWRQFPEGLFAGSPERLQALELAIAAAQ
jgi:spermidine synthase